MYQDCPIIYKRIPNRIFSSLLTFHCISFCYICTEVASILANSFSFATKHITKCTWANDWPQQPTTPFSSQEKNCCDKCQTCPQSKHNIPLWLTSQRHICQNPVTGEPQSIMKKLNEKKQFEVTIPHAKTTMLHTLHSGYPSWKVSN